MEMVFQKTRELGEALMASEVYQNMKAAEDVAMKNKEAADTMSEYIEKKQAIEELLAGENPDPNELKKISDEMDKLQERLQMMDDITKLTEARNEFSSLINQVNQVLHFIITGVMDEPSEEGDGCTGSCASCGGSCHHTH